MDPLHPAPALALPAAFPGGNLRRLQPRDLAAFQAYRAEPALGRYQGWTPLPDAEARAFLQEMEQAPLFSPGEWVQLGIATTPDDMLVGDVGVCVARDRSEAEIGYTLSTAAQGRGVATHALRRLLPLLFDVAGVAEVVAITDRRNVASIALLRRLDFRWTESVNAVFRGENCVEDFYRLSRPRPTRLPPT